MMQNLGNRRSVQKCAQKAGSYVLKFNNECLKILVESVASHVVFRLYRHVHYQKLSWRKPNYKLLMSMQYNTYKRNCDQYSHEKYITPNYKVQRINTSFKIVKYNTILHTATTSNLLYSINIIKCDNCVNLKQVLIRLVKMYNTGTISQSAISFMKWDSKNTHTLITKCDNIS